jgi:hypothetical protein
MLDDGRIAVYAHMKRFSRRVEECVREMQEETGRYMVDFYPDPDRVVFASGEIVGISGGTGAGPPHLHFEFRNEDNVPLNPLVGPYALPDSTPPRFYRVVLTSMGVGARVDGRPFSRTIRLRFLQDEKRYEAIGTVQIWGEVGLSARVFDRINLGGDRVGVYRLVLAVDDEVIFSREYGSFPLSQMKLNGLVYDRELMSAGFGRCERAYRLPGDDLAFHDESPGDGILRAGLGGLDYGEHTVRITIGDAAGNTRDAIVPVVVNKPPEVVRAEWLGEDSLTVVLDDEEPDICELQFRLKRNGMWRARSSERVGERVWRVDRPNAGELLELLAHDSFDASSPPFYLGIPATGEGDLRLEMRTSIRRSVVNVELVSPIDLAQPPTVFVAPGEFGYTNARMWAKDGRHYNLELVLFPEVAPGYRVLATATGMDGRIGSCELLIPLTALLMKHSSTVTSADGLASITAAPGAVFEDTYLDVKRRSIPRAPPGLELLGPGYQFNPEDAILKRQVSVSLTLADSLNVRVSGGVGVFRWEGGTKFKYVGSSIDTEANTVVGSSSCLGTFALLRDPHPPSVTVSPSQGLVVSKRPSVKAEVHDHGCGVDSERLQMYLDERPVPARPIGGGKWVYRALENLAPGLHTVRMVARDKVGNPGSAQATFRVR